MAIFFWCVPAIPQDLAYHNFADQRTFFGIPNFFDVVSNLMFLILGLLGMMYTIKGWRHLDLFLFPFERWIRLVSFLGITLVAVGSSYYHLNPNNATLLWDRLPMSISFMAILSLSIAYYVSLQHIELVFIGLETVGVGSVLYWVYTESLGRGDLRLYIGL